MAEHPEPDPERGPEPKELGIPTIIPRNAAARAAAHAAVKAGTLPRGKVARIHSFHSLYFKPHSSQSLHQPVVCRSISGAIHTTPAHF